MHLDLGLIAKSFADASQFCGHEEVIHAIVHHRLSQSGIPATQLMREFPLEAGKTDLVVLGPHGHSADKTALVPRVAIEVKGGAYGDRNALRDRIDARGHCDDMAKLQPAAARGVECWFMCVDMPELGRAVGSMKARLIAERCIAHGLNFAYHCQGEPSWLAAGPATPLAHFPLPPVPPTSRRAGIDFLLNAGETRLRPLAKALLAAGGHEANLATVLYGFLREAGFGVHQLSLETYFSFAAEAGNRMQRRPDLAVFDAGFDGRFNLYRGGDRHRSNDGHKLAHLEAIVEVKGGAAIDRKSSNAVLADYRKDIDKLAAWRDRISAIGGVRPLALFLGVDGRPGGLPESAHAELNERCQRGGVSLLLISGRSIRVGGVA
ncbi:hypothetical protein [Accumulibacter sp.]|uniref:hypothetical protein n=1 Tax=Accumulibacter sp. TaxID=2053492 RepID=UPI0025F352BD|nr:hypothetical protein [Accumulibacter sp.]MCM8611173.1 hypothetical protein [Accumulibacter sp.]MCM8634319.1 hypothetical protein [Accumulibacter sp.]MCM8641649.1 hypothetical protein [Accumulibacter sp.]